MPHSEIGQVLSNTNKRMLIMKIIVKLWTKEKTVLGTLYQYDGLIFLRGVWNLAFFYSYDYVEISFLFARFSIVGIVLDFYEVLIGL